MLSRISRLLSRILYEDNANNETAARIGTGVDGTGQVDMHTMIIVAAVTLLLLGLVILLYGAGGRLRWASVAWGSGNIAHAVGMLSEFFVLVPDGTPTTARAVAERLRHSMAELPLRYGGHAFNITVTIGGATAVKGESPADLIRRADPALYLGKRRGRNGVEWG